MRYQLQGGERVIIPTCSMARYWCRPVGEAQHIQLLVLQNVRPFTAPKVHRCAVGEGNRAVVRDPSTTGCGPCDPVQRPIMLAVRVCSLNMHDVVVHSVLVSVHVRILPIILPLSNHAVAGRIGPVARVHHAATHQPHNRTVGLWVGGEMPRRGACNYSQR